VSSIDRRRRYRPGVLRRAGAGAWHVPAGFIFIVRRPRLWPLAALPALMAIVCVVGGALAVARYVAPYAEDALVPGPERALAVFGPIITLTIWIGLIAAGAIGGLAVALLLTAPVLERLSRRAEIHLGIAQPEDGRTFWWEVAESFRGALYFLIAAPLVLLLSLVPVIGPPAALLWGSYALSFQQTDVPLARRGLNFAARRAWHRRWRAESIGFGLAGLFTLLVPFANLLVTPALAVGGTLLVLELKEGVDLPEPGDRSADAVEN
jgi:uncharacterized protein involved in cysteine biosynthesis